MRVGDLEPSNDVFIYVFEGESLAGIVAFGNSGWQRIGANEARQQADGKPKME